jgi:hypothetical protein
MTVYDTKQTEVNSTQPTVELSHTLEMDYHQPTNETFKTINMTNGDWNVTDLPDGDTETIKFNSDGTITEVTGYQQGFGKYDVWQITDEGELETIYYLYGVPITTYTYKIVGNESGCYIVDYTNSGDWYKQYKMCQN